jgi:hypothetical protein
MLAGVCGRARQEAAVLHLHGEEEGHRPELRPHAVPRLRAQGRQVPPVQGSHHQPPEAVHLMDCRLARPGIISHYSAFVTDAPHPGRVNVWRDTLGCTCCQCRWTFVLPAYSGMLGAGNDSQEAMQLALLQVWSALMK